MIEDGYDGLLLHAPNGDLLHKELIAEVRKTRRGQENHFIERCRNAQGFVVPNNYEELLQYRDALSDFALEHGDPLIEISKKAMTVYRDLPLVFDRDFRIYHNTLLAARLAEAEIIWVDVDPALIVGYRSLIMAEQPQATLEMKLFASLKTTKPRLWFYSFSERVGTQLRIHDKIYPLNYLTTLFTNEGIYLIDGRNAQYGYATRPNDRAIAASLPLLVRKSLSQKIFTSTIREDLGIEHIHDLIR